eukprot:m.373951 g.373951  ORF g.373951 m.373951 type:complete len:64 (-) comp69865_c0_seq1:9-200(-)
MLRQGEMALFLLHLVSYFLNGFYSISSSFFLSFLIYYCFGSVIIAACCFVVDHGTMQITDVES